MAKDAKPKDSASGPAVDLRDGTGEEWRKKREEREYSQRELARRIGTTSGTISNVETGKQRSLERGLYLRWRRALYKEMPSVPEDLFEKVVDVLADMDNGEAAEIIQLAQIIKKRRK